VSSRRGTSKNRSLEATGCARASVISAEVVTGCRGHEARGVIKRPRESRGLSLRSANTNSLFVIADRKLRDDWGSRSVAKPIRRANPTGLRLHGLATNRIGGDQESAAGRRKASRVESDVIFHEIIIAIDLRLGWAGFREIFEFAKVRFD
jgi:hypothetical protein